jgi:hypothetical protein
MGKESRAMTNFGSDKAHEIDALARGEAVEEGII